MRILVCGDSHGRAAHLLLAAERQPSAEVIVYLGDGEADSEALLRLPERTVYRVCGNCDFGSQLPGWERFGGAGRQILWTHGHLPRVNESFATLRRVAGEKGAQIALFGHTHTPFLEYEEGLYLFNPGAIKDGRYGFVDITPAGIVCQHCRLD